MTFSSGLGATTAIASLLNQGDHIVAMDDLYGGTYRYFSKVLSRMGVNISFVDARDPAKVASAMQPNTKVSCNLLFELCIFLECIYGVVNDDDVTVFILSSSSDGVG